MNLFKTSFYSGIAVVIRMITLLSLNKIFAIYVGPAGYALIGQFQNAVTIVTAFSSGAVNNGVVKYTAEYTQNPLELRRIWQTSFIICLVSAITFSILIATFSQQLAQLFLKNSNYDYIFLMLSITLVFFVMNTFFLAILNGLRQIRSYVLANIIGSLLSLLIAGVLATKMGLAGALTALALNQSFAFFATFVICLKKDWFKVKNFIGKLDHNVATNISKFALMALVSTILSPLVLIAIRYIITNEISLSAAGYWESLNRLSGAYLTFFTTTLSVYLLPKLSSLTVASEIRKEILTFYKLLIPLLSISLFFLYLQKENVISLLFSSDFIPVTKIMGWQIAGDFFKMLSWVLSYIMLSKAMVKLFIITEIVFQGLYLLLTWELVRMIGLEGATIAYFFVFVAYFVVLLFFVFNKLEKLLIKSA